MTFDVIVSDIHVIVLQASKAMFQALVFESHHLVIISIRKALIARKKRDNKWHIAHELVTDHITGLWNERYDWQFFFNFPSTNKGLQLKQPRRKEQIIINKNKIA